MVWHTPSQTTVAAAMLLARSETTVENMRSGLAEYNPHQQDEVPCTARRTACSMESPAPRSVSGKVTEPHSPRNYSPAPTTRGGGSTHFGISGVSLGLAHLPLQLHCVRVHQLPEPLHLLHLIRQLRAKGARGAALRAAA